MKKSNTLNTIVKAAGYLFIVVFFFLLGTFSSHFARALPLPTGSFDPSDPAALEKNSPIEVYGVTCGRADTNQNKCCQNRELLTLNPERIASAGAELEAKILNASSSAQLTSNDLSLIEQAVEASRMDASFVLARVDDVLDKLTNGDTTAYEDRQLVASIVHDGIIQLQDTSENTGPAKLMARQIFTPDKCLIKTRFVKLCIRGIMEFFASIVDATGIPTGISDVYKQTKFTECEYGVPTSTSDDPSCICKNPDTVATICRRYISTSEASRCDDCITNKGGFWTGIGCIGTDPSAFAQSLFGYGLSIGGAFSLLCIFYAAFILQTSRGNPEKIKKAKEDLRACITGLLVIIFSIFIVRLIGIDLLRIPGFN